MKESFMFIVDINTEEKPDQVIGESVGIGAEWGTKILLPFCMKALENTAETFTESFFEELKKLDSRMAGKLIVACALTFFAQKIEGTVPLLAMKKALEGLKEQMEGDDGKKD